MGSGGAVEVTNSASASSFASAGSDIIDAGDGDNLVAGDAMSFTAGATLLNTATADADRSEEHTSELQSLMRISYAVFCLKKKKQKNQKQTIFQIHTLKIKT